MKKKSAVVAKTERDNTYVYRGFYERLQRIDVKNAPVDSYRFDQLLAEGDPADANTPAEVDAQMLESNFITLLAQERMCNPTMEFRQLMMNTLEELAASMPLLLLNKAKIVTALLSYLKLERMRPAWPTTLELLIALVKDLRSDIYEAFIS